MSLTLHPHDGNADLLSLTMTPGKNKQNTRLKTAQLWGFDEVGFLCLCVKVLKAKLKN